MRSYEEACDIMVGAVLIIGAPALEVLGDERIGSHHLPARYAAILEAARAVHDDGHAVDHVTVKARLEPAATAGRHPWRDRVDMAAAVDGLAVVVPDVGNLRGYCAIVREHAWFTHAGRQLLAAGDALERRDRDGLIAAASQLDSGQAPVTVGPDQWDAFVSWYHAERRGIPLPFPALTEAVGGGLQPGEVTMLGGWPGMGKTLLAKDMLLTATAADARCHDYANEQFGPRRTARLLSSLTGISAQRIRRRELSASDWEQVAGCLAALPYETTPTPGWGPEDYCREIRRQRWDMCVIDTVTNLPCSKVDEWDRAAGMLADAAAQAGTHLVLVCQLNLERAKSAVRPAPVGRDLRSTGAWYQRAKVVMFVHCDEELREGIPVQLPEGHIRVDKANDGDAESGFVQVYRNQRFGRFDPLMPLGQAAQEAIV